MKTNTMTNTTETKDWSELTVVEKLLAIVYIIIGIAAIAFWFYNALMAVFMIIDGVIDWVKDKFGRDDEDDEDDEDDTIRGFPYTGADKDTRDAIAESFLRAAAAKGAANAANEAAEATASNGCEAASMDTD